MSHPKSPRVWPLITCGLLTGIACLPGCQDKNNNGMPDSPATSQQVENAVNKTEDTIQKGVDKAAPTIEKGLKNAVPAIEKTVEKGASLASDAGITAKVKTAFIQNKTIDAASIDVTTKNKIVYLNGHVASNAQRALASKIAMQSAGPGHPIKNALKVVGKAPAKAH